jgi:exopolysaccharide biosynthesis protein
MTLREIATLLRALGAPEALNLDGGGSTAMALVRGDSVAIANRVSDAAGERAVGDALGVVDRCHPIPRR